MLVPDVDEIAGGLLIVKHGNLFGALISAESKVESDAVLLGGGATTLAGFPMGTNESDVFNKDTPLSKGWVWDRHPGEAHVGSEKITWKNNRYQAKLRFRNINGEDKIYTTPVQDLGEMTFTCVRCIKDKDCEEDEECRNYKCFPKDDEEPEIGEDDND